MCAIVILVATIVSKEPSLSMYKDYSFFNITAIKLNNSNLFNIEKNYNI